jgi:solute carrier family 25 (mitochondrial 2-oxodicarboxylate transporter), member 21
MADIEKLLKQAAMQIGAGGSAGFIEVCIMHPLDLVKTRLQLQATKTTASHSDPHYYNGIVDCMKKMYKYEGLTSFWKGILPPILAETPKRAVKFFTFEQYKQFFMFGSSTPTPLVSFYLFCLFLFLLHLIIVSQIVIEINACCYYTTHALSPKSIP